MTALARFDPDHAQTFLASVFAGLGGFVQVCCTGNWSGRCFSTDAAGISAAVGYAAELDAARPQGIYFRASTLRAVLPAGKRGGAADTLAVPMLWADVDYGTDGHKGANLPPHSVAAHAMIRASGLPEPTLLVHSGGGLYPLWLFAEPLVDTEQAAKLSEGVQHALAAAHERHGFSYGTGVGDLARVLRLPGSVNRKTAQERPCHVGVASGRRYHPHAFPVHEPPRPAARPASRTGAAGGRRGVFDALAETAEWADIWEPAGWSFVTTENDGAQLWRRPGASSAYSARCGRGGVPTAVVHSEAAGLPSGAGQRLTKGRVFAHLHYDGDEPAAARDLIAASRGEPCTDAAAGLPEPVLEAIRQAAPTDADVWALLGIDVARLQSTDAGNHGQNGQNPPSDQGFGHFGHTSGHVDNAATAEELESWLTGFTGGHNTRRLARRLGWMLSDGAAWLPHHAVRLVVESLAGDYPAELAVRALVTAYRHHHHGNADAGGADPDAPLGLLAAALGVVLTAAVPAQGKAA